MTSLSYLYLSGSNFVNFMLPKWLSNATILQTLDMAINNIEGPISNVEWGKLCNLRKLYPTQNKINGDISRVMEGLSSCSNTTLEEFPNSLGDLKNLRMISIPFNQISGTIPTSIEQLSSVFNLTELNQLFLATNDWEGNLSPNDFAGLHQLKFLAISRGKRFAVNLSNEWIPPFSLTYIEIRKCGLGPNSNSFHGLLPLWPNVTHLNLANNLFSGSIPINIDFSGNNFTGSVPYRITRVDPLMRLDLSDNHLSGKIPDWWDELQLLHVVDLSGNNLSVHIPSSICSPPSFFWVRLSRYNLFGELPKSLRNCKSLLTVDIRENKINRTIPEWFGESLLSLQKLSMTDNMIGSIRSCLGSFRGLKSVKFYKWHPNYYYFNYVFTPKMRMVKKGTRMTYTSTLDQVNLIDFSCFKVKSQMRLQVSHYLNLSYNNLSGPIPSKTHFGSFTNPSSFEGNPKLLWFLVSARIVFVITFLVTFSSLMMKKSWGYSYFHFLEEVGERIIRCCIVFKACLYKIFRVRRN
ncbi:unnamed protein product [Withania somnifera]